MAQEYVFPALIGAVAAITTSFGERFLGRFFDKREKLEALRDAEFGAIEKVVFEIRDLATGYWARPPEGDSSVIAEGSIVKRLTFVSELLDSLFRDNLPLLRDIHVATNRFDTACTSGSFSSKNRAPEPGRCRDIEIAAYTLIHRSSLLRRKL
jgi:hypothetical protein